MKNISQKKFVENIISKFRPFVKNHGGDVKLAKISGDSIFLRVIGACEHCPLADLSYNKILRGMIEEKLPRANVIFENIPPKKMSNRIEYVRNKPGSTIGKIVVDRDLCISVASCVSVSPEIFKLDTQQKAVVIDPNLSEDQTIISAAQSCPTQAIIIYDSNGKQLFP